MRLYLVELRRFRLRSLVWITAILLLGVVGITAFSAFQASKPPSEAQIAQDQMYYEQAVADWEEHGEQYLADCLAEESAEQERLGEGFEPWDCEGWNAPPRLEDYTGYAQTFADSARYTVEGFVLAVAAAVFLVGASFVAAEIATGALGNWLTFEPRRTRVYLSKTGAAATGSLVVSALVLGATVALLYLAHAVNGAVGTMTADGWRVLAESAGRGIAACAGAAVGGVAIGALTRHTAATLGTLLGYVVVVEAMLVNLVQGLQPWTLGVNLQAWIAAGARYYVQTCTREETGELLCTSAERTVSMTQGGVYLLVVVALFTLLALLVFRRRDVS